MRRLQDVAGSLHACDGAIGAGSCKGGRPIGLGRPPLRFFQGGSGKGARKGAFGAVSRDGLRGRGREVKQVFEGDLLRPGGILIFEHSKKMNFSDFEEFWQLRSYGSVQFSFFKKV